MPREHDRRAGIEIQNDGDEKMMRHRQAPDDRVVLVNAEGLVRGADAIEKLRKWGGDHAE